jgi:hypothetical protein
MNDQKPKGTFAKLMSSTPPLPLKEYQERHESNENEKGDQLTASKPVSQNAGIPVNQQTSKPANQNTSTLENQQINLSRPLQKKLLFAFILRANMHWKI